MTQFGEFGAPLIPGGEPLVGDQPEQLRFHSETALLVDGQRVGAHPGGSAAHNLGGTAIITDEGFSFEPVQEAPVDADTVTDEAADRTHEVYRLTRDPETYEVTVESDVTLADIRDRMVEEGHEEDFWLMVNEARQMQGKRIARIGATMEGGGVAKMAPPWVHALRLLGVDVHWYVLEPDAEAFEVTKGIHNGLQNRPGVDGKVPELTDAGIAKHEAWIGKNFTVLGEQEAVQTADIVWIDDPQPAPLIRPIKAINPQAKFVFRNHIQSDHVLMDTPGTIQNRIHRYLWDRCGVGLVDAYVFHPVATTDGDWEFVPDDVPEDKRAPLPAVVAPDDDENRILTDAEVQAGLDFVNEHLAASGQPPLSLHKPRTYEIARFDPAKGMDRALALNAAITDELREMGYPVDPEGLIVGNGSRDDRDGQWVRRWITQLQKDVYGDYDIKVERLKHNYAAKNAIGQRRQLEPGEVVPEFLLHPADAEGWEDIITWAVNKGIPAVVNRPGGPKYQVIEGQSGFVVDFDNPEEVRQIARTIAWYMAHPEEYARLREQTLQVARDYNKREFVTTANVTRSLRVCNNLLSNNRMDPRWRISEMAEAA